MTWFKFDVFKIVPVDATTIEIIHVKYCAQNDLNADMKAYFFRFANEN